MQRVAIRPTHSAPQPISTCSEASLIILYPPSPLPPAPPPPASPTSSSRRQLNEALQHAPFTAAASCLTPSWQRSLSPLLHSPLCCPRCRSAAPAERLACAHVLLADTSCTGRGGAAADGCDSGSSPGRADSPAGVQALLDDRRQHAGALFQPLPPLAMRLATAAAFFIDCSPDVS